eukprot:g4050.t1
MHNRIIFETGFSRFWATRQSFTNRSVFRSASNRFDRAKNRKDLFSTIVPIYDQINDVMSLGQHWEWKKMCVRYSGAKPGNTVLDLCCGSGDLTHLLATKVGPKGKVIGLDFSPDMLKVAKEKNLDSQFRNESSIEWIEGDALNLDFPQSCFDAITVGYGLRNVVDIKQALSEILRVLKPGGKASILDFNKSEDFFIDTFQNFALNSVVVPAAQLFGMEEEYKYLYDSIQSFPSGNEQESLCLKLGFVQAKHYEIASGLMGILIGQK